MNRKAVALLLALFTLVIVSLLVVAFLELTTTDLQIISNHLNRNQALYIADAGVEYAVSQLRYNRNWRRTPQPIVFPPGSGSTYDVTYSSNSGRIISTGALSSGQSITLEVKVSVKGTSSPYEVEIIYWKEL